jgi:hypothetical protein
MLLSIERLWSSLPVTNILMSLMYPGFIRKRLSAGLQKRTYPRPYTHPAQLSSSQQLVDWRLAPLFSEDCTAFLSTGGSEEWLDPNMTAIVV